MKSPRLTTPRLFFPALCALCVLPALWGCATDQVSPAADPSLTAEVEQHADGCGANLYRGPASVSCDYTATLTSAGGVTGTCVGDSQLSCDYGYQCLWGAPTATTICIEGAGACAGVPPPYSPASPEPHVYDLPTGSTLCDPPASANDLRAWCNSHFDGWRAATTFCANQSANAEQTVTCCRPTISVETLPGAAGG